MALNVLALISLIGFSQLIVLGIYFYRKGRLPRHGRFWRWPPEHDAVKPPAAESVLTKPTQRKAETLKMQNGKATMTDIAEKALKFLDRKKEEELGGPPA